MRKPLPEEPQQTGFNLMVTYRDEKTGLITHTDPYILRIVGESGSSEKTQLWERPKGSGNLFDKENNKVGRWVYEDKVIKGKKARVGHYEADAEHIDYVKPLTQDQLLARELSEKSVRLSEVEKELAALKAEAGSTVKTEVKKKA
jgi:hypothetical protein